MSTTSNRRPRIRRRHHQGPSIRVDRPMPGFYRMRAHRGGPWLPVILYLSPARDPETGQAMDRAPALLAIADGREADPYEIWTRLHPIGEAEYRRLCREREGVIDTDLLSSPVRI